MDLICGNSQAVIADLRTEGVQENQLRLIYNGVDLSRFDDPRSREAVRQEIGTSADALVFVIVANLIPYKGHTDLVEAFGMIHDRLPERWECWCIGRDDGILTGLQSLARRQGIDAHVRFLGSRQDVPDLLNAADIGVLCSHEEGFSNAVLEGMAAALPMVVTDVGGNAEAVTDGATGRVVPPRSPDALAKALLAVAEGADRAAMGRRGQDRARTVFSINACLDAYEALYREGGG
jgi:glycosyltransferase involved in cell wall biosynthesis